METETKQVDEEEFVPMTPMQYRIVGGMVILIIIIILKLLP